MTIKMKPISRSFITLNAYFLSVSAVFVALYFLLYTHPPALGTKAVHCVPRTREHYGWFFGTDCFNVADLFLAAGAAITATSIASVIGERYIAYLDAMAASGRWQIVELRNQDPSQDEERRLQTPPPAYIGADYSDPPPLPHYSAIPADSIPPAYDPRQPYFQAPMGRLAGIVECRREFGEHDWRGRGCPYCGRCDLSPLDEISEAREAVLSIWGGHDPYRSPLWTPQAF